MTKKSNDSPALAPQQFTKKPVTIWAIQWEGNNTKDVLDFVGTEKAWYQTDGDLEAICIETLEGRMRARIWDWIIKGTENEFYPCKPDIFEKYYSPALAEPAAPSQLKILVNWLRKEADERMKAALGRRPSPEIRNMTAAQLKESKRMSEKMFGRKMDLVSTSIKENLAYCDMQDKIADKQEAEARQLNEWADLIVASAPSKVMDDAGFDEATETRWQTAIYELCKEILPDVDGGGCDSGDALDVTLSEISQVFGHLQESGAAPSSVQAREAFEKIEASPNPLARDVHWAWFVSGWNARASSPSSATEQEWVNVSDKLPPLDNQWSDSGHNFAESFAKLVQTKRTYSGVPEQRVCVFNGEVWSEIGGDQITDVTHWRELPESPISSAGTPEGK